MIYDVDTLWKAESGLVWSQLVPGAPLTKEIGVHVFYRCQCTTVETVRELTEFAKCIPGFVDLFLNDQVSHHFLTSVLCHGRALEHVAVQTPVCGLSAGYVAEVWSPRGHFCHAAISHEQRWTFGSQWERLCNQGVPSQPKETVQWDHGAQVWVCCEVQCSGVGWQWPGLVCCSHYSLWRWDWGLCGQSMQNLWLSVHMNKELISTHVGFDSYTNLLT